MWRRRAVVHRADELVEAATEARGAGRPSLSSPGVRSPSVTVRLPQGLNAKLDHEAARTGKRRSEIVREALEAALALGLAPQHLIRAG